MKNNLKFLAVLSTAAVMSAVAPGFAPVIPGFVQTASAADAGWVEEDGELRYKDGDGYYLSDSWKKRDSDWYYLDEDGFISRSMQIDDYYVNEDGKRIYNQWVIEENEDYWGEDTPENFWYYYGKDGKATVSKWITIDGKEYYFNSEGHMETGKITLDGHTYYLGEEGDGSKKTGWIQLENEDEDAENDTVWHFFDSKGRMIMNEIDRKITGHYYTFENGVMQTGWYKLPSEQAASETITIDSYQYYLEDGKRASGWLTTDGIEGIHEDTSNLTFYFKEGKAYHSNTGIQVFIIDSKRYGFDTTGVMQTDLQTVTLDDGVSTANFYFGEDGAAKTGKQTIYDENLGENQTWFFQTDGGKKGQGFHGIRDNSVYRQGLRLNADRDLRYSPVTLDEVQYLVNVSGAIQKASASSKSAAKPELGSGYKDFKDSNDTIWTVDVNGIVQN